MPLELASPERGRRSTGIDLASIPDDELSDAEFVAKHHLEADLEKLDRAAAQGIQYSWEFWGRPDQQWPTDVATRILALISGRGAGKTRTGSEHTRLAHKHVPRLALAGATYTDVRKYSIEGDAGILACSPRDERPDWSPGTGKLTWPNGCVGYVYAGTEPDRFRGESLGFAWLDEFASWPYAQEAWDNLTFAFRAFVQPGWRPMRLITTTPRPTGALVNVLKLPGVETRTVSTYRNQANVPDEWLAELLAVYEGTRLGDQELHGVFLGEIEGALWTPAMIERGRIRWATTDDGLLVPPELPELRRVGVGVDPPGRSRRGKGAECGIVVVGREDTRPMPTGYVLADYSMRGRPAEWGAAVRRAWLDWGADRIYAEDNEGHDMVVFTLEQAGIPPSLIETVSSTTSKGTRAEPVSALSEKDPALLRFVGQFPELEAQCTTYVPTEARQQVSPDRMDAMVHAATQLLLVGARRRGTISSPAARRLA